MMRNHLSKSARLYRRGIALGVAGLLAALLASCAQFTPTQPQTDTRLAPAPYFDPFTGIYFPGAIESLHRQPVVDLEKRNPGLGLAVSYRHLHAKLNVFLYDLQASAIPVGIDSAVIQDSFREALDDLQQAAGKGLYGQFAIHENHIIQLGSQPFLHARFSYSEDLLLKDGHLLVAGVNGKILKIRATLARPSDFDLWRAFGHFANSLEQARRNGFGGIAAVALGALETQLRGIRLDDGLGADEARAIAQRQVIALKLHNRFDTATATSTAPTTNNAGEQLIRFSAFQTDPPRLQERFLTIAVASDGSARMLSLDE